MFARLNVLQKFSQQTVDLNKNQYLAPFLNLRKINNIKNAKILF